MKSTPNDDDHFASGRGKSGLGVDVCVGGRATFSVQAQAMIGSDASEESTDAEIVFCCDDNGEEVVRFASDGPGAPRNAMLSLNGFIGSGGRGAATECVEASVEVDALLQSGQTMSNASWSLTVSVRAAP